MHSKIYVFRKSKTANNLEYNHHPQHDKVDKKHGSADSNHEPRGPNSGRRQLSNCQTDGYQNVSTICIDIQ